MLIFGRLHDIRAYYSSLLLLSMKTKLCLLVCLWGCACSMAWTQTWKLQKAQVTFSIKMLGATVNGTFSNLDAHIVFDANHLSNSHIDATVQVSSIDTQNDLRNKHLKEKESFFLVQQYPVIQMQSLKIEQTANAFLGTFHLTMKNITKTIKIPFSFEQHQHQGTFKANFVLNRRDWQVGGGTWGMSNDVNVSVQLFVQE